LLVVDDINFIKPVEIGLFYCILFYSWLNFVIVTFGFTRNCRTYACPHCFLWSSLSFRFAFAFYLFDLNLNSECLSNVSVVVAVAVEMQNLKSRELSTTNTFYFTFKCHHSPNDAFVPSFKPSLTSTAPESVDASLPQLIPRSYEESMLYLRARRVLQSNHDQSPSQVAL
jgi:acyl-CoA hydrolase